ncbi:hypothetical protein [Legionella rowbothamii]|uniref:hypothetical protein n=1 Tax=Legionella rowbothamii TaxID=96229 RepID=UPI0010552E4D|nr:hypothetical protein [Legionella rowbothamii]
MSPNPLAKLVQSPTKTTRKQLQLYVTEYAGIVDALRLGGVVNKSYTDADRAQDMQRLVNAAEKIKMIDFSGEDFKKSVQGLSKEKELTLRSNYREYVEIKKGNMSPQQLFKELNIKLPVPEPILDDATLMKKLQSTVTKYNAAENNLKVGQFTTKYTDVQRTQDLQKLVDGAEQVKRLHSWIPKEQFDRAIAALPDWQTQTMFKSYLVDMEKIASGKKSPNQLANSIDIKLPIPAHQVPSAPPSSPSGIEPQADKSEAPKKEGFFSRLKNKLSDMASGFASYMKEHPVRGGLLIAGAIIGIGVIVAASVFTGGAAAVGGFAALMGTGISTSVVGAVVGGAVAASSAIALAYDVNKDIQQKQNIANLHNRLAGANTGGTPEKPAMASPLPTESTTPAWRCGIKPQEDRVHNVNNGNNAGNKATTTESRENLLASKGPIAPGIESLASETDSEDDTESESPHM